jgi:hypothetical protein
MARAGYGRAGPGPTSVGMISASRSGTDRPHRPVADGQVDERVSMSSLSSAIQSYPFGRGLCRSAAIAVQISVAGTARARATSWSEMVRVCAAPRPARRPSRARRAAPPDQREVHPADASREVL